MKRFVMSILVLGTAIALSAAPSFAGGSELSDGDLDNVYGAFYTHGSDDTLIAGSGGGIQNNDDSQRKLTALNNVNASQSNVANQINIMATLSSSGGLVVKQSNRARFNGNNGDNSGETTLWSYGHYNKDDDVLNGGSGGGVQNNDKSQKGLTALNNVNASQSNVANQSNLMAVISGPHDFSFIKQSNKARFSGDNGSNKSKSTHVKDPKNKDDLLMGGSGGGVQNNNESQKNLMALNNVNASQSNVANQANIAVASDFSHMTHIFQSNSASFSGNNGGNRTGGYHRR